MRGLAAAVLFFCAAVELPAQRGGHIRSGHPGIAGGHPGISIGVTGQIPYRTYGSVSGFGNVVFPGTGNAPPHIDPFSFPSTFAQRLGATVSGYPGYRGNNFYGRRNVSVWPVAYPVYVGDPYGYQQQEPPNITIVMPPQAQAAQSAPPVTIQQYFGNEPAQPVVREYGPSGEEIGQQQPDQQQSSSVRTYRAPVPRPAEPSTVEPVLFFIGLKDASVYTAVAYWVEGETLHYVTPQGKHNQVSLDLVDRDVSERLNRGRAIEFRLPPAKR